MKSFHAGFCRDLNSQEVENTHDIPLNMRWEDRERITLAGGVASHGGQTLHAPFEPVFNHPSGASGSITFLTTGGSGDAYQTPTVAHTVVHNTPEPLETSHSPGVQHNHTALPQLPYPPSVGRNGELIGVPPRPTLGSLSELFNHHLQHEREFMEATANIPQPVSRNERLALQLARIPPPASSESLAELFRGHLLHSLYLKLATTATTIVDTPWIPSGHWEQIAHRRVTVPLAPESLEFLNNTEIPSRSNFLGKSLKAARASRRKGAAPYTRRRHMVRPASENTSVYSDSDGSGLAEEVVSRDPSPPSTPFAP